MKKRIENVHIAVFEMTTFSMYCYIVKNMNLLTNKANIYVDIVLFTCVNFNAASREWWYVLKVQTISL